MIKGIKLKNFKCFPEIEVPFSQCSFLAGANAAGKSTIIQAILLAFATIQENDVNLDVSKVLGIPVGNPRALIAQNKTEIDHADFMIKIVEEKGNIDIQYSIDKLSPLKLSFEISKKDGSSHIFYLNAERQGPRISYPAGIDDRLLSDGSNAAFLIDRADMEQRKISDILSLNNHSSKFSIHVEEWMNIILGNVNFSVVTDLVKATTDIKYKNSLVDDEVLPTMTGFGISYILSIVTAGLWCSGTKNAVLIIENPEAHLHPFSQSRMGKFLQLVSASGVQVIVETHSEHVIDGARVQAALMGRTDEMEIEFFSCIDRKIEVQDIRVDVNGELADWPVGFFDQKSQDLRELFYMRRNDAGK